ncbi:hypothetical protein [Pseudomonas sp. LRF_L74]|uniref:hypothetical protein n=1 Tax=Pseudomonas sp. LRF_L74 TaxID=3369422 RepID=UPI003F626204
MNDQLKTFLSDLLYTLTEFRKFGGSRFDSFVYALGKISAAETLGVIDYDQFKLLRDLLVNASCHQTDPFPCAENSGPVMDALVAWSRREAAAVEVKPPVQVAEPEPLKSRPSWLDGG